MMDINGKIIGYLSAALQCWLLGSSGGVVRRMNQVILYVEPG